MKVAILGITNLRHMSLISLYTSLFKRYKIDYDLIYIDKYGIDEPNDANHVFKYCSNGETKSLFEKIRHAKKFKKYASKLLLENNYDFVVVWRENTAAIFAGFLKKNFKGRYSVNIRDLWNFKNFYITYGLKKAVKYSKFNTIASEGFRSRLPGKVNYLYLSSVNSNLVDELERLSIEHEDDVIKIINIGTFRNDRYFFGLVDAFANDHRFELRFIGQGSERMAYYCNRRNISNVICEGAFSPDETVSFLKNADILNCSSGREDLAEDLKTPIRFFYGVLCRIPMLTLEKTYINEICGELELGISISEEDIASKSVAQKVYDSFMSFNINEAKISNYLKHIYDGQKELENIIKDMVG